MRTLIDTRDAVISISADGERISISSRELNLPPKEFPHVPPEEDGIIATSYSIIAAIKDEPGYGKAGTWAIGATFLKHGEDAVTWKCKPGEVKKPRV